MSSFGNEGHKNAGEVIHEMTTLTKHGSSFQLSSVYLDHVCRNEFIHCRADDRKFFRNLKILDLHSWQRLSISVERKQNPADVVKFLAILSK